MAKIAGLPLDTLTADQLVKYSVNLREATRIFNILTPPEHEAFSTIMDKLRQLCSKGSSRPDTVQILGVLATPQVQDLLTALGYRKVQAISPPHEGGPVTLIDL